MREWKHSYSFSDSWQKIPSFGHGNNSNHDHINKLAAKTNVTTAAKHPSPLQVGGHLRFI